jgi:hypothetical protein
LEGEFEKAIIDMLSERPFQETFSDFMNKNLPKDLKKLAIVIGKLDFVKTFQKSELENQAKPLTLKQIALKCFYEGKVLNRESAKKELEGTKYKSNDKLYAHFTKWSNTTDRRADPEGKNKLLNKINDFERVIGLLPLNKTKSAIDDINILKSYIYLY